MKTLYTFLLVACVHALSAQCVPQITITPLGLGSFSFTAFNETDTVGATTFTWVIESDTLTVDSAYTSLIHHFDTNGTYNIQLGMSDTSASCLFDTVWQLVVEDADYVPLLDSVNIWHYTANVMPVMSAPAGNTRAGQCGPVGFYGWGMFTEFTSTDTLINGVIYKTLQSVIGSSWPQQCTMGYIREDLATRRIYFWDVDSANEFLLYDFSLHPGDSISLNFYDYNAKVSRTFRLDSIVPFTVQEARTPCKQYCFSQLNAGFYTIPLRWVEGIGTLADLIYPYVNYSNGWGSLFGCPEYYDLGSPQVLICREREQLDFYDACALGQAIGSWCFQYQDTCNYGNICGSINELSSLASIDIFPNPAQTKVTVELDVKIADGFALQLLDLQGKAVSTSYNPGRLGEGKHNLPLTLPVLPAGMYMLECRTREGVVYKRLVIE